MNKHKKSKYYKQILKKLKNLCDEKALEIYNDEILMTDDFCKNDLIYHMYEFNEILKSYQPYQVASKASKGYFNYFDNYFSFDIYGNLISCNSPQKENWLDWEYILDCWYNEDEKGEMYVNEIVDFYNL